ncbi:hypothetical protein Scep_025245 [Stephania cephalantha]|uniref:Uncharacterized protein n=1 Tax=Stephania cephalantha TaxID=152367 RepID=A0AAP0EHX3_9MAGN
MVIRSEWVEELEDEPHYVEESERERHGGWSGALWRSYFGFLDHLRGHYW